jgi:hypothetical protein
MEYFWAGLTWWITLAIVAAIAILGITLLNRGRSAEVREGFKPSKEEEIQTLIKEIERLRGYAQLLEEKLEAEKVAV